MYRARSKLRQTLSLLALFLSIASPATGDILPVSATGPKSNTEMELLWKQARSDFDSSKYSEANYGFTRYFERYPLAANSTDALFYAGKCRIKLGKFYEAQRPLKDFIAANPVRLTANLARIDLSRAYLALGKHPEATLLSMEILASKYPKSLTPEIETAAYLVRAQALLMSGKNDRARETLDDARKALEKKKTEIKKAADAVAAAAASIAAPTTLTASPAATAPDDPNTPPAPLSADAPAAAQVPAPAPSGPGSIGFEESISKLEPWSLPTEPMLGAELEWLALKMKDRDCLRIEAGGLLTETQVFDLAERRGSCLLEAALIIRRAFELDPLDSAEDEQESMEKLVEEYLGGFTLFTKSCMNPPNPPGKRSRIQIKRYKAELVDKLQYKCDEKRKQAGSFLDSWKTSLSPNRAKLLESLKRSIESLPKSLK